MAYDLLGVCRLIVNYSNEKEYNISNLKLQKLLYYTQAYFLVKKKRPCFDEDIEAWACGPIVPAAYLVFEQYGGCNIPEIRDGRIGKEIRACVFRKKDAEDIKDIVDVFSGYSASAMTALSMKQGPWKECREFGKRTISEEDMRRYFSEKQVREKEETTWS